MFNARLFDITVAKVNEPREYKGKDGELHTSYSFYALDGIYPVFFGCSAECYENISVNSAYDFECTLRDYKGQKKFFVNSVATKARHA